MKKILKYALRHIPHNTPLGKLHAYPLKLAKFYTENLNMIRNIWS